MSRLRAALLGLLLGTALPAAARAQNERTAQQIAQEVIPAVERAVGLKFRKPPDIEVRSHEQVREYLRGKLAQELPPGELAAVERAYRAFGLVPDSLDLKRLMLNLYNEQVAGYYDPDSGALFVVRGTDPLVLRLVMAHELVHALQDEYMPLDSILDLKRQNDRQMAGQAVAEGQATLASVEALAPGTDVGAMLGDWNTFMDLVRSQQGSMPVFASSPPIIQQDLLFPYVAGARFIRAFDSLRTRPDEQPYGKRMPVSTAQVLHPGVYAAHRLPEVVGFAPASRRDTLIYDDDFGEFESRVALETWGLGPPTATAAADGWDGDRYEVLGTPSGTVVLWASAWTTPADADRFQEALAGAWARRTGSSGRPLAAGGRARGTGADYAGRIGTGLGPGPRRWRVERLPVGGEAFVYLVDAPAGWPGWRLAALPAITAHRMAR